MPRPALATAGAHVARDVQMVTGLEVIESNAAGLVAGVRGRTPGRDRPALVLPQPPVRADDPHVGAGPTANRSCSSFPIATVRNAQLPGTATILESNRRRWAHRPRSSRTHPRLARGADSPDPAGTSPCHAGRLLACAFLLPYQGRRCGRAGTASRGVATAVRACERASCSSAVSAMGSCWRVGPVGGRGASAAAAVMRAFPSV